jgi:MAF protein
MKRLILASSSPRRFDLLKYTGLSFEVARPDINEDPHPHEPADLYVKRLSQEKAQAIASTITASASVLILAADTTVADGDQILGKPESDAHAAANLRQLRGRAHVVHTGMTLLDTDSRQAMNTITTTHVIMRPYSDAEIAAYIASGDPVGKAGSYAIQNREFHPVDHIEGCYSNVVGLPICVVYALLAPYYVMQPRVRCSPDNLPCDLSLSLGSPPADLTR